MTHQRGPHNPSDGNPLYRKAFNCNYTFGTGTDEWFITCTGFKESKISIPKDIYMAKDAHNKAAEHHENAAKAHRMAAEHHGKGDHESDSGKAHEASKAAHEKSEHQK